MFYCFGLENPAYPAHAPNMDEDEDEADKSLVRPASRNDTAKAKRDLDTDYEDFFYFWFSQDRRQLHLCEKGPPEWQEQKIPQFCAEKQQVKSNATF